MDHFSLPEKVSSIKHEVDGCTIYTFRHQVLGELGRLVLRGLSNGHCHIDCQLSGDVNDPMTEERRTIFEPLGKKITKIVQDRLGTANVELKHNLPGLTPQEESVALKLMECDCCGEVAALLIFAEGATEPGHFADYARKLYHKYSAHNVPAWIIGDLLGPEGYDTPSNVFKVWPTREPIKPMKANAFSAELDEILENHCK